MSLSAVKSSTAQTAYALPDSFPPAYNTAVLSYADVQLAVRRNADGSLLQFMEPDVFNAPNSDGIREPRNPMPSLPLLLTEGVCIGQPDDKGLIAYEI